MDDDEDLQPIAALLADECAQTILVETAIQPKSADELSEACEVSEQTIYRRLESLTEHDLIEAEARPDSGGGQRV